MVNKVESERIAKECYEDFVKGLSYSSIAEKRNLKSRGSAAGYIFRYRKLMKLKVAEKSSAETRVKIQEGMVERRKRKRKGRGNPQALRNKNAAIEFTAPTDLIVYVREDGVRITKDTKPRATYGCGFDWKGI